ncbi:hypothetical protein [Mycolicibacterium sp. YH-1]|uniref:hypothetical protein n=1 Tax=Mycolicibacterium sp. YH-1 TaxID=2908837 RepID=UPI001F4BD2CB|nr:hypothetical protein [Mycolicibacterium sp. YH-1]UNB54848.1 hypothetical protein L0M16_11325 [Mycolicibacterium sp. YH-1]
MTSTHADDFARIRPGFQNAGIPDELIDALFDAYAEAKRRFYLGDHRPNEVEGGRFVEAAIRVLQLKAFGAYTPIGKQLSPGVEQIVKKLESTGGLDPSLGIHIPRHLLPLYTIRNKRDVAHLGPGISPNLQDSTIVVGVMDWVMAEFVRLYHQVSNTEAQQIIDGLVTREVPAIQMFGDYPKLLKGVTHPEHLLILLYRRGAEGAARVELGTWTAKATSRIPTKNEKAATATALRRLDANGEVHIDGDRVHITTKGQRRVETKRLVDPA